MLADFCSNDYLGFARSPELRGRIREEEAASPDSSAGSTGSRLISGNSRYCEDLEKSIAEFHKADTALMFNSGYDANIGILSSIPQRNDIILYDQLAHASIRDGIRLSHARAFSFKHNDLPDLEQKLSSQSRAAADSAEPKLIVVAVESVYSMDGDCAPLTEMAALCEKYGASLVVDEAHATGVFGERGEGRVVELGLEKNVFVRLHTFGKAVGSHGAAVLGSDTVRSYLINFARSFIYTTALPFHSLAAVRSAYRLLAENSEPTKRLGRRIAFFKERLGPGIREKAIRSDSAIQCFVVPGNENVKAAANELQEAGFDVRPIMHPTVPAGAERLRICLHAFNTEKEIEELITKLGVILK